MQKALFPSLSRGAWEEENSRCEEDSTGTRKDVKQV
jgi:hypothetical protein